MVPNNMLVPPGALAVGVPAKILEGRSDVAMIRFSSQEYVANASATAPRSAASANAHWRANPAMSRAVSALMSGQAMVKISVPCMVPIIWRHRAATPASRRRR